MGTYVITRADDFGSARAADAAILAALRSGAFVRNVSCMAVGGTVEQDAAALADICQQVDIGLHFTLNSEWDILKWEPCMPREQIPSLLDDTGNFYQTQQALVQAHPDLDEIERECTAQLDRLTRLGLPVSYVDTHMAPDAAVPGLSDRMRAWAQRKGLLYVWDFYHFPRDGMPAFGPSEAIYRQHLDGWLDSLEEGNQYVYFMHPARLSDETMAFSNHQFAPGVVAWERELEARLAVDHVWADKLARRGVTLLRYRDARCPAEPLSPDSPF